MIKAVIFDLDHTVFDRHATLTAIVPALRSAFQVDPALSDEEIAAIWGEGQETEIGFQDTGHYDANVKEWLQ